MLQAPCSPTLLEVQAVLAEPVQEYPVGQAMHVFVESQSWSFGQFVIVGPPEVWPAERVVQLNVPGTPTYDPVHAPGAPFVEQDWSN